MRPQFYDFIELFEENITVDHISSDLICWECDSESREEALLFMDKKNYDLLGIRRKGKIIKKVLTNKDEIKNIYSDEIIPDNLPITKLLDNFLDEHKTKYFLNSNENIEKIVTIGDLSNWQDLLGKKIFKKKIKKDINL